MLGLPKIEAVISLSNQSTGISTTPIFTPPRPGLYRYSAYATATVGSASSSIYWDDEAGSENLGIITAGVGSPSSGSYVFRALPSSPISFNVSVGPSPNNYNLDIVIESL
jgi:hypothetical protein